MPPPGERRPSQTGQSGEFDGTLYKLLYEFELRLDSKLSTVRDQTREDIQNAVALAVSPINGRLDAMAQRNEERWEALGERLTRHSGLIAAQRTEVSQLATTERMAVQQADGDDHPKNSGGWISADKLPAIIAAIGSVIASVIASVALMRSPSSTPAASTTALPPTPVHAAPP